MHTIDPVSGARTQFNAGKPRPRGNFIVGVLDTVVRLPARQVTFAAFGGPGRPSFLFG